MKQPDPIFHGSMVKGEVHILQRERDNINRYASSTWKNGQYLDIVFRKHSEKRSNQQNKYYWAVVVPILADHIGHDLAEDMHEDLKFAFNPVRSKIDPSITVGGSTTKLSTVGFNEYIERICKWAASENIKIPEPNEAE